jgi:hypothetical protein
MENNFATILVTTAENGTLYTDLFPILLPLYALVFLGIINYLK